MFDKKVFSTHEAARICHVHHTTVINWVNQGKLPSYSTPGGHRRIKREDLVAFMEKFGMPKPPGLEISHKKVLLVDDDEKTLSELSAALADGDFTLKVASDGFEAGKLIYGYRPDLILLDFMMPGMDGFQVLRSIQKDEVTRHIPVIAITVLYSDYDLSRMRKYGVDWYMEKPVEMADLKGMIDMALGLAGEDKRLVKKYSLKGKGGSHGRNGEEGADN